LLLVRHLPDDLKYRLKNNSVYGLALGTFAVNGETYGKASFSGKGTYLEPGWTEPIGNYEFTAYVEDRNEPGRSVDRFWIEIRDKDRVVVPAMSMAIPGATSAIPISGGNIQVPHSSNGKGGSGGNNNN
jgi:hypothetical protein